MDGPKSLELLVRRAAEPSPHAKAGNPNVLRRSSCPGAVHQPLFTLSDQAKPFFDRAKEIAQFLRQDTLSTSKSYSPIIPNALVASEAEKALEHLAKLLDAGDE